MTTFKFEFTHKDNSVSYLADLTLIRDIQIKGTSVVPLYETYYFSCILKSLEKENAKEIVIPILKDKM